MRKGEAGRRGAILDPADHPYSSPTAECVNLPSTYRLTERGRPRPSSPPAARDSTVNRRRCRMPAVEAQVAVAKVAKYATSVSGDSLEMIERPSGGLSFVLVDGQLSGKPAKAIASIVVRKAVSLLADGVRDGAAARAASDYLFTHRSGKVLASLNILSFDLQSQSLVITRNNPIPALVFRRGLLHRIEDPVEAVGSRRDIRPEITEFPLEAGLAAVIFTDGLVHAGSRTGRSLDVAAEVVELAGREPWDLQGWADSLLAQAVALDEGRPADDISVLVGAVLPRNPDDTRRLFVRMPL